MNRKISVLALMAGTVFLFNVLSCSKGGSDDPAPPTPPPPPAGGGSTTCSGTRGPLFTAVKTLVESKCVSCHNGSRANGGMNFADECNIVINKARIKVRAIDIGDMPQTGTLSSSDKNIITTWLNAGGAYTN